jgi:hypothetical protein
MTETYQTDITPRDLEEALTVYLCSQEHNFGFQRCCLEALHPSDKTELIKRDKREVTGCFGLTAAERWRSDDYLLYSHSAGNIAYIRLDPFAPRMGGSPGVIPFDVHLMIQAQNGFLNNQYYALTINQAALTELKEILWEEEEYYFLSSIVDLETVNVLARLPETMTVVDELESPVHIFNSVCVSISKGYKTETDSKRERAIQTLSTAIGSVIIASQIFAEKQSEYYKATAGMGFEGRFLRSAIIGCQQ